MKKLFTNLNGILFTALVALLTAVMLLGAIMYLNFNLHLSSISYGNHTIIDYVLIYVLMFVIIIVGITMLIAFVLTCLNLKKNGRINKSTSLIYTISTCFVASITIALAFVTFNLYIPTNISINDPFLVFRRLASIACILVNIFCIAKSVICTIINFKNNKVEEINE